MDATIIVILVQVVVFALVVDGVCRGMSSYLDIEPAHNTLEIGFTYYDPAFRGGVANPSAKRLLMAHAFQSGAQRVQYRVDARNARSRAVPGVWTKSCSCFGT